MISKSVTPEVGILAGNEETKPLYQLLNPKVGVKIVQNQEWKRSQALAHS
jgi:hypothetical protein